MSSFSITKKILSVAILAAFSSTTYAENFYVAGYGGSFQKIFEKEVFPKFEQETGDKVIYVPGNSTDTLAKMRAQRNNPQLDVAIVDGGPMQQALGLDLCGTIDDSPAYKDVYDMAYIKKGSAMAFGVVATGLFYNAEEFKKLGWAAPTSWADLADPKYKGKLVIPPISVTYGLQVLVQYAKMNGGSINNIQPGFKAIIDKVNPNVLAWEPSPGKISELFQNKEALIGAWGSSRVAALKNTGTPVKFVYPKEGAYSLFTAICPVKKKQQKPEVQKFIQLLFAPDVQKALAVQEANGPMLKTLTLDAKTQETVPYSPDEVGKMQTLDWTVVNKNRVQWTNQWNRTVER